VIAGDKMKASYIHSDDSPTCDNIGIEAPDRTAIQQKASK
jgi:hypothetical protein